MYGSFLTAILLVIIYFAYIALTRVPWNDEMEREQQHKDFLKQLEILVNFNTLLQKLKLMDAQTAFQIEINYAKRYSRYG